MAFAATQLACVHAGPGPSRPLVETLTAHPEPELVTGAPSPPSPGRQPARVTHKVAAGETLYRIARTYEIEVAALMKANQIVDPRTLAVGQELVIPGAAQQRPIAPPGAQEAPEAVAAASGTRAPAQKQDAPAAKRPKALVMPRGDGVLAWPLRGVLYARFGKKGRERHDGIDLAAPAGTPVKTARAGTVLYAGEQKGYGLIAIVDHGEGLVSLYAHNRDLRVRTGQKVRDGQVIATVGESGRTSGPQLHFEVRKDGIPQDPLRFLGTPPDDQRRLGRRGREESR